MGSDVQDLVERKISQESPIPSAMDKADSLADLQQSTEKDFSFVSQTESKVYSKESKHRSDSLDETSQFSDLEEQIGSSPAHRPGAKVSESTLTRTEEKLITTVDKKEPTTRDHTLEFLKFESEFSSQTHAPILAPRDSDKVLINNIVNNNKY